MTRVARPVLRWLWHSTLILVHIDCSLDRFTRRALARSEAASEGVELPGGLSDEERERLTSEWLGGND